MMIKRAGVFSAGVDDLSNSVAFEYFREGCFVDVAHSHHIEKVTGVVEHHLLLTGSHLDERHGAIPSEVHSFAIDRHLRTTLLAQFSHALRINTRTCGLCFFLRTDEHYFVRIYLSRERGEF